MLAPTSPILPNERVRAILLTGRDSLMLIKRVKPHNPTPYWVAPGGGVEGQDRSLRAALMRELHEELGADVQILRHAFTLRHIVDNKNLHEYFYVCKLLDYNLALRNGPEFNDPTRGDFIPDDIPLTAQALGSLNLRTPELRKWLIANMNRLHRQ